MRYPMNWALLIRAGIEQLCRNNLICVQGRIFAPSGGLNRFVREYLESEGGIKRKIWLRKIWETELGKGARKQLRDAPYLRNIVLYELDPKILDRISHQLANQRPRLVLRRVHNRLRIVEARTCHRPNQQLDSDLVAAWPL